MTANEKTLAEHNAAIQKHNAEVELAQHNAQFEAISSWQERQAKAIEKHPDFVAVTTADDLPGSGVPPPGGAPF